MQKVECESSGARMRARRIPCDREPEKQLACDLQHCVINPLFY